MKNRRSPRRKGKGAPPSPRKGPEAEIVYGRHAALAVFAVRREAILSIDYLREAREDVDAMIRWAQTARVPVREVLDRELDRKTESTHHEGVVLTTKPRRWAKPSELAATLARAKGAAIALDRVRNPHNIGAIVRSAAFFGLDGILLGSPAPHPGLAPSAVRVAQGGAEHLMISRTTDLADTLARMRGEGVTVVATDARAETSALDHDFARPTILVLGNEREGLSDRIRAQCDLTVAIRGTGAIDSLNVAVAAGVLVAQVSRGAAARSRPREARRR